MVRQVRNTSHSNLLEYFKRGSFEDPQFVLFEIKMLNSQFCFSKI